MLQQSFWISSTKNTTEWSFNTFILTLDQGNDTLHKSAPQTPNQTGRVLSMPFEWPTAYATQKI